MNITTMSPREFSNLCETNLKVDLIDVRTTVEFREVHLPNARNVPLDQLDPTTILSQRGDGAVEPIYVICRSGSRGRQACEKFIKAGFENVINIEGGTIGCVNAGLAVVRGAAVMSLERQVRIAAGSLVLTGAVLAWFVNPAFVGLSAFVGAGLVFAGVTDTCGMGLVLARMPWNQAGPNSNASCPR